MKISTKGRYALRLMLELANNEINSDYLSIKTISENQNISLKYLEQIIILLHRANYVKSLRGASGGYRLVKSAEEYTVGMILRLTEGSLAPVACLEGEKNTCPRASHCKTLKVWQRIYESVNQVVDNITLADLRDDSDWLTDADDYC